MNQRLVPFVAAIAAAVILLCSGSLFLLVLWPKEKSPIQDRARTDAAGLAQHPWFEGQASAAGVSRLLDAIVACGKKPSEGDWIIIFNERAEYAIGNAAVLKRPKKGRKFCEIWLRTSLPFNTGNVPRNRKEAIEEVLEAISDPQKTFGPDYLMWK